jgi:hemoglobin
MNLIISHAQFGVRPPVTKPHPDFLKFLGEKGFRKLVSDHYELIKDSDIRQLFPMDDDEFEQAKVNAADFMIQISGGEAHFNNNRGTPRMVGRHAPFRITAKARHRWLELYKELLPALEKDIPVVLIESFWKYLDVFSIWMINTEGE